ncbi:hypothetical protein FHR92_005110 [Fontibacillus solani]|uniref:Zinc-ribbon domain-containing protein n=1 Tax=Fontibacillus solani TaxID=1572857 RepID=A0A7W3XUF5_9BACL|nr:DUF2628 domain-containing protein [Fontibacillus solani]MBA9088593.1 hypothetical protein [Fontibacillus solani]
MAEKEGCCLEARYCSSCGQRASMTARFCESCGRSLEQQAHRQQTYQQQANQQVNHQQANQQSNPYDVPEEEWLRLFSHSVKYVEKWHKNSKWNWPSFLFFPLWSGYRKMYAECALYIGAIVMLVFFELLLDHSLRGVSIGIAISNGILGNKMYYRKAKKEIDHILLLHGDSEIRRTLIQQKGGTSGWGIVYGIVMILIGAFLQVFLAAILS